MNKIKGLGKISQRETGNCNETGILDMKPYLDFGVFQRLKERDAFNRVRVSFDTIEWDSGIDLDPEFVYNKSQRSAPQQGVAADANKVPD